MPSNIPTAAGQPKTITAAALFAFITASFFYLYQYVTRTAPGTF